jgi:hypothetical protein
MLSRLWAQLFGHTRQSLANEWADIGQTLGRHQAIHFEKHLNLGFYVAQNVDQNFDFINPRKLLILFPVWGQENKKLT